ncbi:MAG: hypothetical protein A2328_10915 [Bdellovibrionales bacterium RIFOXYB2_FULL_36_6]|nr:MAG: hypothetical protein A2328_10915 [Bdellovibrionales bacterium RIFOXYB2_FULL_36_6]
MEASIVDLRYKMHEILTALDRNESVQVFYHGKLKAVLMPAKNKKAHAKLAIADHPAFGLYKQDKRSVKKIVRKLRQERRHDI